MATSIEFDTQFATQAANLCYEKFDGLPKSGKPISGCEWTSLAAIIKTDDSITDGCNIQVVSLATGSKCIGKSKLSSAGDIINDSHAEVRILRSICSQRRRITLSKSHLAFNDILFVINVGVG